jgi:hypothetical protein
MGCGSSNVDDSRGAVPAEIQHELRILGIERMEILEFYAYFCALELTKDGMLDLDMFLIKMKLSASKLTVKIFNSMDPDVADHIVFGGKNHKHKIAFKEFVMYVLKFATMEQPELAQFTFDLYSNSKHHNYLDGDCDLDRILVSDMKEMITSIHGADHATSLEVLFSRMVGESAAREFTSVPVDGTENETLQPPAQDIEPDLSLVTGQRRVETMDDIAHVHEALNQQLKEEKEKKDLMDATVTRAQFVEHIVEFPSLLYPVFSVQSTLRREILGTGFWGKLHSRAQK